MLSINIRGVARPAAPKILTAKTLTEAVRLAKSDGASGKAQKIPVVVGSGNQVRVVSR